MSNIPAVIDIGSEQGELEIRVEEDGEFVRLTILSNEQSLWKVSFLLDGGEVDQLISFLVNRTPGQAKEFKPQEF